MVMVMKVVMTRVMSKKTSTRLMARGVRRVVAKNTQRGWRPDQRTSGARLSLRVRRSKSNRC